MLSGGRRQTGCPYQSNGVVLDSRGNIQYCAPKSESLGNTLQEDAWKLYSRNLSKRRKIIHDHCQECIHDYHFRETFQEKLKQYRNNLWEKIFSLEKLNLTIPLICKVPLPRINQTRTIFITGWYGTETTGDKAILGAIMDSYEEKFPGVKFIISSIHPFVTQRTLKELNKEAKVIPTQSFEFFKASKTADEVVMGGGPLMGIKALNIPIAAFMIAKEARKKTTIFGCGIGPFRSNYFKAKIQQLLNLSDEIILRDQDSGQLAKSLTKREDIIVAEDPAKEYVKKRHLEIGVVSKKNILACFLREWTQEYQGGLTNEEFDSIKNSFEENLAKEIKIICKEFNLRPHFYSMHTFCVGGDDRIFHRKFTKKYFQGLDYYIENSPSSVDQIIKAMQSSSINICMRFHSVLFAQTLGVNFIPIDYTQGGKIKGFLKDKNLLHRMIKLEDLAIGKASLLSSLSV